MTLSRRRLGRVGFFVAATAVYSVILFMLPLLLVAGALRASPAVGFALIGGVSVWWLVVHARRLADSRRGHGVAFALALVLFGLLAIGYGGLAGWFGAEAKAPDFASGRTLEQGMTPGLDWLLGVVATWLDVAGPLAAGALKWLLFGLSKVGVMAIGVYSLVTLVRQPVDTALPPVIGPWPRQPAFPRPKRVESR